MSGAKYTKVIKENIFKIVIFLYFVYLVSFVVRLFYGHSKVYVT